MEYKIKKFDQVNVRELYDILRLRCKVFIVDLNCPLMDIDGADPQALHGWLEEDGEILACLRILKNDKDPFTVNFGRVLSKERGRGYGKLVVEKAIRSMEKLGYKKVFLASQSHAKGFYEKLAFKTISEEYIDENGLAHYDMEYIINS